MRALGTYKKQYHTILEHIQEGETWSKVVTVHNINTARINSNH